ncbi:oligosaccharide flippase family protein [Micromonospora sp. KC213]|uniref:lipopolysaccharide biosynthesis protein n=1 Tax=Micromonospora sp. KC213 TaxID=2530378 RepID=UPI00104FFD58|nr:oligosaccharide flippase family protein [Micromonospora sp. KC213]TDC40828.1 lipopolysaccharide biosynthesis protein [Micromonospora sp. KC213]
MHASRSEATDPSPSTLTRSPDPRRVHGSVRDEADVAGGRPQRPVWRRLASWITTAALSRIVSAVTPLVLIPVLLSYLGPDLYGLWAAVLAVSGMVALVDLGLSNGLMTKLAPCYATGDVERARRYISTAYVVVSGTALTCVAVMWCFASLIPWSDLFNAGASVPPGTARAVALAGLTGYLLNVPLSLTCRVLYAYQRVGASIIWQAAGGAAILPMALLAIHAELPPALVVTSSVSGMVFVNIANFLWTYGWPMREMRPGLRFVDRAAARRLLRLSGLFFVLTVVTTLSDNADGLIVAHVVGLSSLAVFAVVAKLFNQLGLIVTMVNQPLWPLHGEALMRGRVAWVRRTVRRMTVISTCAVLGPAVILVLVGDRLFAAWLPVAVENRWLLVGFGLWWALLAAVSPRLMVQNAAGLVRPQIIGYALYFVVSVPAKIYGLRMSGVEAVPFVGAGAYLLTVMPAALYGYRRVLAVHEEDTTRKAAHADGDRTGHTAGRVAAHD